jgi:hypothetical protein
MSPRTVAKTVVRALAVSLVAAVTTALPQAAPAVPVEAAPTQAAEAVHVVRGKLADGAPYVLQVPQNWNGTVAVYAHGLIFPGDPEPERAAFDPAVGAHLLADGTALAASRFGTGWSVERALVDQRQTVRKLAKRFGTPQRVIAYGDSLGGLVSTALVERFPRRFDGGLSLCGAQAGAVADWNHFLDSAFVFKRLLGAHDRFRVTSITDPVGNATAALQRFGKAQKSAAGRARLALTAAIAQLPGGRSPAGPSVLRGAKGRFLARMDWMSAPYLLVAFAERGELEALAGGNPSWNTGVDYARLLGQSGQADDVRAAYQKAGLSLQHDLAVLAKAERVRADADAVRYVRRNAALTGRLSRPVLTLRNVSDGALPSSNDRAYADAVAVAARSRFLRQTFVDRAGHCTFTPAEVIAAFDALDARIAGGVWPSTSPEALAAAAAALGDELNQGGGFPVPPAFVTHEPRPFPRPDRVR